MVVIKRWSYQWGGHMAVFRHNETQSNNNCSVWFGTQSQLVFFYFLCPEGDDSSTGNSIQLTDTGTSKVADNTSAVISFKLPSVLESYGKKPLSCRRSNSSSSSDDADSIPFQASANSHMQRGSMSTQKPSVKSTPDFKSGQYIRQVPS